jgi:2'-5' RNA ligase
LRLFIALNFPDKVKQALGAFMDVLSRIPSGAKWVEAGNLHLTIQFLGNTPSEQVPAIVNALHHTVDGIPPFSLALEGVGVFPAVERPRVLWVGVSGETALLSRLHRRVREEMDLLGFEAEKRRFSPHLTLARIKSPVGFSSLWEMAAGPGEEYGKFGSVKFNSIELMQSELGPKGPKYSILARIPLSGGS